MSVATAAGREAILERVADRREYVPVGSDKNFLFLTVRNTFQDRLSLMG